MDAMTDQSDDLVPYPEISPEEQAELDAAQAKKDALAARLDALGGSLVRRREEAIAGRKASGIEDEWLEAEEFYQGIDDANRAQLTSGKPSGPNGGYVNGPSNRGAQRSTIFLNITRPYVDAAAARVGDMLLPTDDTPWSLRPTPHPSSYKPGTPPSNGIGAPGTMPALPGQAGMQPMAGMPMAPEVAGMQPPTPGMPAIPGLPGMEGMGPPPMPKSPLEQAMDAAKEASEAATKQIEDWHIECQWHAEVRKMIEDCARLGTGILKGPFPVKRKSRRASRNGGMIAFEVVEEIKPATKAVSPWKFYPDPGCGEDIQSGSYVWEEDSITAAALRDLVGVPGYIDFQIEKVLEEGPKVMGAKQAGLEAGKVKVSDKDAFRIWYFYGYAEREDLEAADVEIPETIKTLSVPCIMTMVNDTVIRVSLNPLDSGAFPYDAMPWQRRYGMPWGTGVAKQINTPQRMLNAGARNLMDNAGLSSGPQIVMRKGAIVPADGTFALTPRKFWWLNDNADAKSVADAITAINIPTMQGELMSIIQFALKMAEDVTGLPMLMQGQSGETAPDTVGGMQILNNNASVVLRRIARMFDDKVTEPHIRRYYEYLLIYGEDEAMKGDFQIDARGSTALVERDIQNQAIIQMGQLAMNPAFGIDPDKWMNEALKAQRLDPKRFLMDDEKKAQLAQQPPPEDPRVTVAKLQAELQTMRLQQEAAIAEARIRGEFDRDTAYVEAQNRRDAQDAEQNMMELMLKRELALLAYANKEKITIEQVRAKLAESAMKINSVHRLAGMGAPASAMPKPPVEPVGVAPDGMSYQR